MHRNELGRRTSAIILVLVTAISVQAGTFQLQNRSEIKFTKKQIRAAQFLQKATFGASQAEIDALANRMIEIGDKEAAGEWIDNQIAITGSKHVDGVNRILTEDGFINDKNADGVNTVRTRNEGWYHVIMTQPDQLRQKTAWVLSQILVIGPTGNAFNNKDERNDGKPDWMGMANYHDILCDGAFGSYRDLLEGVTYSPMMGIYLSHRTNQKANRAAGRFPDENYAREVMQLFSIGLYSLKDNGQIRKYRESTEDYQAGDPIETYTNKDIEELARVFTGLNYADANTVTTGYPRNVFDPMKTFPEAHDSLGKNILGQNILGGGTVESDIDNALDIIVNHRSCPPFICRLMIQRFVKSNPSKGYIKRVVDVFKDNGNGERGDLGAVVKAILLDPESWNSTRLVTNRKDLTVSVVPKEGDSSRLREPLQQVTTFLNALNPFSNHPQGSFRVDPRFSDKLQEIYYSPSVFNFYLPNYQPIGTKDFEVPKRVPNGAFAAPEFEILNGVTANRLSNYFRLVILWDGLSNGRSQWGDVDLDFQEFRDLTDDIPALLQRLDLLLCQGNLSDDSKQIIIDAVETEPNASADDKLYAVLMGVVSSPQFAITR